MNRCPWIGAVAILSASPARDGTQPRVGRLADYFPGFGTMQAGVPGADGSFTLEPQKRPILIHDLFRHTSRLT